MLQSDDNRMEYFAMALQIIKKFTINVDYDQPMEQLLRADRYSPCPKPDLFPSTKKGKAQIEILLVEFGTKIWTEDALRLMEKEDIRPVTLIELLALHTANPKVHMEGPILALGSSSVSPINRLKYAPVLQLPCGINIVGYYNLWTYSCRFAAVQGQLENIEWRRHDAITITSDEIWEIAVDHGKSFEQLLEEGKYFKGVSYDDVKRFPSRKKTKVTVEMHLLVFEREVTSEEAINEMSARRLRPATIKELLVFGPKLHLSGYDVNVPPVVALGSVGQGVSGRKEVPLLTTFGGGVSWGLITLRLDTSWGTNYQFLAIRKSK